MEIFCYNDNKLIIKSREYCESIGLRNYEERLVEFLDENLSISETLSEVFDIGKMRNRENTILYAYRQGLHRITLKTYPEGEIIDCAYIKDANGSRYVIPIMLKYDENKITVRVNPRPDDDKMITDMEKRVFVQPYMVSFNHQKLPFYLYTSVPTETNTLIDGMPASDATVFTLPNIPDFKDLSFNPTPHYYIPLFEENGVKARILCSGADDTNERCQDMMIDVVTIRK